MNGRDKENISNPSSFISLIYTNADALLNKMDELQNLCILAKPDILVITEVLPKYSMSKIQEVEIGLNGYNMYTNILEENVRGMAIYIKDHLMVDLITCPVKFSESIFCRVRIKPNCDINLLGVYRSPNSSDTNNNYLIDLLQSLASHNDLTNLIVVGDFNLNKIKWDTLQAPSGIWGPNF